MTEALLIALRSTFDEWLRTRWSDLQFTDARTALLVFVVLAAIAVLVLFARAMLGTRAGRTHITLPALLPGMRRSPLALARHVPLLLFVAGLPFFGDRARRSAHRLHARGGVVSRPPHRPARRRLDQHGDAVQDRRR